MIGLLNAYHFDATPGNYQEMYQPIFLDYLKKVLPEKEIKTYAVAQGELPKDIHECDSWIITGSPASVYEEEMWIKNLIEFVKECHQNKVKMLGICFGHQLLAKALGGEVVKSDKGWGFGVKKFKIKESKEWMTPPITNDCSLLFFHQDQVTKLPKGAKHLAGNEFCPFQMYSIGDHVFSIQGHPEFTRDYTKFRVDNQKANVPGAVYTAAIDSLEAETDELIVGEWINNFLHGKTS